jgi:hypothetical protein
MNAELASFIDTGPNSAKQILPSFISLSTYITVLAQCFNLRRLGNEMLFQGANPIWIFAVDTEETQEKLVGVVSHEAKNRSVKLVNARNKQLQEPVLSSV